MLAYNRIIQGIPKGMKTKGGYKMPKIQFQKGSLVTTIPKEIIDLLKLEKGDFINFNVVGGEVKIVRLERVEKE